MSQLSPRVKTDVIGMHPAVVTDLYYFFLKSSWLYLLLFVGAAYLATNALFGWAYASLGSCVANARTGSFSDAFFFSVQTLSTIGYGNYYPTCTGANVLVTAESLVGLVGFAVVTGLAFNKFSRPQARIQFSRTAVVTRHEGVPTLMFRVANQRANFVAEATANVTLLKPVVTAEGRPFTRMLDLKLVRQRSSMFVLTWTVMHPITDDSPLAGETAESFASSHAFIICTLTGFDDTIGQTLHARHVYHADEIVWSSRFVDILRRRPDGRGNVVDYRHFHAVESDA